VEPVLKKFFYSQLTPMCPPALVGEKRKMQSGAKIIFAVPMMAMSRWKPMVSTIGPAIAGPLDRRGNIQQLDSKNNVQACRAAALLLA